MASPNVSVKVGVDIADVRAGLARAGDALDQFGKGSRRAMEGTRVFSDVLVQLGGASSGAGKALGSLLSGFATGGGIGVALAGVQSLIGYVKDLKKEQEETAKALRESAKEAAEAWREVQGVMSGIEIASAGGDRERDALRRQASFQEKRIDLLKKLHEAEEKLEKATAEAREKKNPQIRWNAQSVVDAYKKAYEATFVLEKAEADAAAKGYSTEDAKKAAEEQKDAAKKAAEEEKKRSAAAEALYREYITSLSADEQKMDALMEKVNKLQGLYRDAKGISDDAMFAVSPDSPDALNRLVAKLLEELAAKANLLERVMEAKREGVAEADKITGYEEGWTGTVGGPFIDPAALKDLAQKWEAGLAPIQTATQSFFNSIIQGGQRMEDMLKQVFKNILSAYVSMLIQMAVGRLATSIAGMLFGGPAGGLLGGGVQAPEMIPMGKPALAGPAQAINIYALDSKSFKDALSRNDSALFEVLSAGRRDRRIS